ncbi:glutathione S-transferase family protein [Sphingomonas daechungensis]|uniref:Glutathione S-transferase family protein n=1 Tax=Sphingomonas daechungensis TaxID=1176646 RepID=A0ABX6T6C3_9SPHN|nr:glutathione S-transferase family protein [Sphingomonas daechungensis]QNP44258.1 glutathione S-transferase family protein [Sphingomonas daechungensis]
MPVDSTATAEVTAYRWVPGFAQGLVRDLRVRWALEEIERPYRVRLLDVTKPRPEEYFCEQPFGQVPAYRDDQVQLFESGAILIHLGMQDDRLMPADHARQMRAIAWVIAALNSVEPAIFPLLMINVFNKGEPWTEEARPKFMERLNGRLKCVSDALGDKEWLEDRFTIADLLLVTVLRQLRGGEVVDQYPNLAAHIARGEARPAFQRALADQLAVFAENEPQPA